MTKTKVEPTYQCIHNIVDQAELNSLSLSRFLSLIAHSVLSAKLFKMFHLLGLHHEGKPAQPILAVPERLICYGLVLL